MSTLSTIAQNVIEASGQYVSEELTAADIKGIEAAGAAGIAYGLSSIGPALGIGYLVGQSVNAIARQPEAAGQVQTTMFLGLAFTEALALIGFVVFILLKFV